MNEAPQKTADKGRDSSMPLLGIWSKGRLRRRLMFSHILVFLVAIIATMVGLAIQLGIEYKQKEADRIRALAEIVSSDVKADDHRKVEEMVLKYYEECKKPDSAATEATRKQELEELEKSEEFRRISEALKVVKRSSPRIAKVFTVVKIPAEAALVVVVASDDVDDIGKPVNYKDTQGMQDGFEVPSSGEEPPLKTTAKLGMSGYAPLKDASGGVVGMVAVSSRSETIFDTIIGLGWLWLLPIGAGLLLSFVMAWRMSKGIMQPLQKTAEVINRMGKGDLEAHISPHDQQVTRVLRKSVLELGSTLGKRERIRNYYGRNLPPALMEAITQAGEEKLTRIDRRDVSLVRVAINIGSIADPSESPEEYFEVLNAASKLVIDAIFDNGGSVEEMDGAAILGVFGSPLPMEDHVGAAVRAADDIRSDLAVTLARRRRENLHEFGMTIWAHTGNALAGIVGTSERGEFRVLGKPVEVVKSLRRPEKTEGAGPVLTEAVVKAGVPDNFETEEIGESPSPAGTVKLYQLRIKES